MGLGSGMAGIYSCDEVLKLAGIAIVFIALLAIPQIQYRKDKEGYFLMTEDYEAYKELKAKKARAE